MPDRCGGLGDVSGRRHMVSRAAFGLSLVGLLTAAGGPPPQLAPAGRAVIVTSGRPLADCVRALPDDLLHKATDEPGPDCSFRPKSSRKAPAQAEKTTKSTSRAHVSRSGGSAGNFPLKRLAARFPRRQDLTILPHAEKLVNAS
jgi:hypothetical protein